MPEGSIAGVAGGLFEAGAGGDLDVDDLEFDAEIVADGLAVGGPGIGGGLQPVVDVDDPAAIYQAGGFVRMGPFE